MKQNTKINQRYQEFYASNYTESLYCGVSARMHSRFYSHFLNIFKISSDNANSINKPSVARYQAKEFVESIPQLKCNSNQKSPFILLLLLLLTVLAF